MVPESFKIFVGDRKENGLFYEKRQQNWSIFELEFKAKQPAVVIKIADFLLPIQRIDQFYSFSVSN